MIAYLRILINLSEILSLIIMPQYREHVPFSGELRDLLIADAVLTVGFTLIFSGGITGLAANPYNFIFFLPIALIGASLSFILHEYMHKIVAQKFGAIAAFKRWDTGIIITLFTSLFGFLIGLPGATMIYTNRFTRQEEGYVSLAGPLTNFAVFIVFGIILIGANGYLAQHSYIGQIVSFTLFISVWLAFFNMLPIYPLDGSKVLAWNKGVYAVTVLVIFGFLFSIVGLGIVVELAFALVVALAFSLFFRTALRTF